MSSIRFRSISTSDLQSMLTQLVLQQGQGTVSITHGPNTITFSSWEKAEVFMFAVEKEIARREARAKQIIPRSSMGPIYIRDGGKGWF